MAECGDKRGEDGFLHSVDTLSLSVCVGGGGGGMVLCEVSVPVGVICQL